MPALKQLKMARKYLLVRTSRFTANLWLLIPQEHSVLSVIPSNFACLLSETRISRPLFSNPQHPLCPPHQLMNSPEATLRKQMYSCKSYLVCHCRKHSCFWDAQTLPALSRWEEGLRHCILKLGLLLLGMCRWASYLVFQYLTFLICIRRY